MSIFRQLLQLTIEPKPAVPSASPRGDDFVESPHLGTSNGNLPFRLSGIIVAPVRPSMATDAPRFSSLGLCHQHYLSVAATTMPATPMPRSRKKKPARLRPACPPVVWPKMTTRDQREAHAHASERDDPNSIGKGQAPSVFVCTGDHDLISRHRC